MKLMLPCNWDPDLLSRVTSVTPEYMYGSLPEEATLRSSLVLSDVSESAVVDYIGAAAQANIKFIYVMNATCLGNREYSEQGRGDLLQRLQWVSEIGAAGVVTANPFVMDMLRQHFPSLELHISVLTGVNDARKATYYEDIGATVIHLDPQVNRNFRQLRAIRKSVECCLSVVVNEGCLLSCPIRQYHSNMISHSRESIEQRCYVDYCYYRCTFMKLTDPVEYLRSPWIRPEDIHFYEDLGINLFKIAGREKMGDGPSSHTDWIDKTATAYHARRCTDVAALLVGNQAPFSLAGQPPPPSGVSIDSRKLNGFLRFFQSDKCSLDCNDCDYCAGWARRSTRVRGKALETAGAISDDIERIRVGSYRSGR
jgi:collagenase-like PrtC family protease